MAEFQEFPKMLYHTKTKVPRVANSAEEETRIKSQGFDTKPPAQFPEDEESGGPDTSNMPDQNADPTREPAIVSQIEQEATRLAGNQGAKDPAELLADEENGDETSEDPEPPAPVKAPARKGK